MPLRHAEDGIEANARSGIPSFSIAPILCHFQQPGRTVVAHMRRLADHEVVSIAVPDAPDQAESGTRRGIVIGERRDAPVGKRRMPHSHWLVQ